MLQRLERATVDAFPFPHVLVDDVFEGGAYRELADTFPVCPPASGPTGFTIHRGDLQFDQMMARHLAWRELYAACNTAAFLSLVTALFHKEIEDSSVIPASSLRFADHVESRTDKERVSLERQRDIPPEHIFIRFDFMQGQDSYRRVPHLDHRRRLATLLLYFDAPSKETFVGGELVLHASDGSPARHITPAENRAVLFPCSGRSLHSVEQVHDCVKSRRFVQISLTSRYPLWPDVTLTMKRPSFFSRLTRMSLSRLRR